jgi:hypothetical protein
VRVVVVVVGVGVTGLSGASEEVGWKIEAREFEQRRVRKAFMVGDERLEGF